VRNLLRLTSLQYQCLSFAVAICKSKSYRIPPQAGDNQYLTAMAGSGREIIERALDELKANVSADDARTFEITSLQDVWDLARRIEREQNERARNQNMRRLEPILRSLESYSSVVDTFCQGFSPMAWVWVCVLWYTPSESQN
jgi:cytochrome c